MYSTFFFWNFGAYNAICDAEYKVAFGVEGGAAFDDAPTLQVDVRLAFFGRDERKPAATGTHRCKEKLPQCFVAAGWTVALLHESQVAQGGSGGFSHGFINFVKGFVEFILILLCEEVHGFLNVLVLPFDVDLSFFCCTLV